MASLALFPSISHFPILELQSSINNPIRSFVFADRIFFSSLHLFVNGELQEQIHPLIRFFKNSKRITFVQCDSHLEVVRASYSTC